MGALLRGYRRAAQAGPAPVIDPFTGARVHI